MTQRNETQRLDVNKLIEALSKGGMINPESKMIDVIRVAGDLQSGSDVAITVAYDSEKFFAIMK